jgi:hypothetical protein
MYAKNRKALMVVIVISLLGLGLSVFAGTQVDSNQWWFIALLPSGIMIAPGFILLKTYIDKRI